MHENKLNNCFVSFFFHSPTIPILLFLKVKNLNSLKHLKTVNFKNLRRENKKIKLE